MISNTFFIAAFDICILIIIIFWFIKKSERKAKHILNNKKKVIEYYLHKIEEINHAKEDEKLEKIKMISKKLFNEYYNTDINAPYSELVTFFDKKSLPKLKEFSEIMLKHYYRGIEIDKITIKKLLNILEEEAKNIRLAEGNVEEIDRLNMGKIEKTTTELIKKVEHHLKNKHLTKAKKTYRKIEKIYENYEKTGLGHRIRMNRLYDKIIKLHSEKNSRFKKTRENS